MTFTHKQLNFQVSLAIASTIALIGLPAMAQSSLETDEFDSSFVAEPDLNAELTEAQALEGEPLAPTNTDMFEAIVPVVAQGDDGDEEDPNRVTPRLNGDVTSGPGTGYESTFGSLSTFLPLIQNPGTSVGYFEGKWNIDTDGAHFGGNMLFGYRQYFESADVVAGGYLGYDVRDTGRSVFNQFGIGAEAMGDRWEVRANGYIPFSETSQQYGGTSAFNATASGNRINYSRSRFFEDALTGADIEAGYRIFTWDTGNLSLFAGPYFYSGDNTDSFIGGQGRLEVELTDNFKTGVGVRSDEEFGTNVIFTLGASFGGPGVRQNDEDEVDAVLARLANPVARQDNIAVNSVNVIDTRTATNPTTGQPYAVVYVGGADSAADNGTAELPFDTIAAGTAAATANGNGIVFVQSGTFTEIVTVPNSVQLLGRNTTLSTQDGTLLLSGAGTSAPTINGFVTLSSNTTLAGFNITGSNGQSAALVDGAAISGDLNGIVNQGTGTGGALVVATNVDNVTIQDNSIDGLNLAADGIFLGLDLGGVININNNSVVNTVFRGIRVSPQQPTPRSLTINILNNNVQNIATTGVAGAAPGQAIGAIGYDNSGSSANPNIYNISNNFINRAGDSGIVAGAFNDSVARIFINNNVINDIILGPFSLGNPARPFRGGIITQSRGGTAFYQITNNVINIGSNTVIGSEDEDIIDFRLKSRGDIIEPFAGRLDRTDPGVACIVLQNNTSNSGSGYLLLVQADGNVKDGLSSLNGLTDNLPDSIIQVEPLTGNTPTTISLSDSTQPSPSVRRLTESSTTLIQDVPTGTCGF